jgi:ABC-type methionine transport system ATPase subunit
MKTILRLDYPPTVVGQPVVCKLVEQFRLMVNILRAQVTQEEGWLVIEADGSPKQLAAAKAWLLDQGLEVTEVANADDFK